MAAKTSAIAIADNVTAELSHQLGWSRSQIETLKKQIAPKATDDELLLIGQVCRSTGLNPFKKQIYFIHRNSKNDSGGYEQRMSIQTGIDGFRAIAQRTGLYAGSDRVEYDDGMTSYQCISQSTKQPTYAVCRVWKIVNGHRVSFEGEALWSEFYPGDKLGSMWRSKPFLMLGKCAEAQALRKAFPEELGDVEFGAGEPPATPPPVTADDFLAGDSWRNFQSLIAKAATDGDRDRLKSLESKAFGKIASGEWPDFAQQAIEQEVAIALSRVSASQTIDAEVVGTTGTITDVEIPGL